MSILTENIKLYNPFRNRQVLFSYILLLFCIIMIYASLLLVKLNGDTENLKDVSIIAYFIFLFAMYSIGILVSRTHLDFIIRPFCSCLPNHYKITGIIILLMGFTCSFINSTLYISMTHYTNMTWVYIVNIFFAGLFVYFCTVLLFLFVKNEYKPYIFFACIIIFSILFYSIIHGYFKFTFSDYISFSTFPFIVISLCMMFVIYRSMTRPGFKRRYFSGNNQFSFEPGDPKSAPRINEMHRIKRLSEKDVKPKLVENLFFKTLKNTRYLSRTRAIIAKEYCTLEKFFTMSGWYSWIIILVSFYLITGSLLMGGYAFITGDRVKPDFLFGYLFLPLGLFFLCKMVVSVFTPVYHNLLLPVRLADQFKNYIILLLIQMVIAMIWTVLIVVLSRIIKSNMPQGLMDNSGFIYKPLELSILLWPLVIIPVINAFTYFYEQPFITFSLLLFIAVILFLSLYSIFGVDPFYASASIALAIVISNGFFLLRLWRYWFKKDIEFLN
jgi:hypothetical protein